MFRRESGFCLCATMAASAVLVVASSAAAYTGPGTAVEFISYFFTLLAWVGAAFFSIALWPIYAFLQRFRRVKSKTAESATPGTSEETLEKDPALPN